MNVRMMLEQYILYRMPNEQIMIPKCRLFLSLKNKESLISSIKTVQLKHGSVRSIRSTDL